MNIDQKMEYIRKALEMGAKVELYFHQFRDKELAEKAAGEFSQETGLGYEKDGNNGTGWFNFNGHIYDGFKASIFFDDNEFMEEDVDLSGEDHAI